MGLCAQAVEALQYLEPAGMTVDLLRALHHLQERPGEFQYSIGYFATEKVLGEKTGSMWPACCM